jgi:tetratricopeptide (TPR) repeat protein
MSEHRRPAIWILGLGLFAQISVIQSVAAQTVSSGPSPRTLAAEGALSPNVGVGSAQAVTTQGGQAAVVTPSLLANANYWRSHGEPAVALNDLLRVLSFSPNNPDVLAAAAEVSLELDDYAAATKFRLALARVAPNDPRIVTLATEHQRTPAEVATLAEARRLAKSGKGVEAVARYKELFHGTVPPSLALEYYDVLGSSSSDGFDEAHEQLGKLADAAPDDDRLQLAYARLLTRSEDTRNEGIRMLAALSKKADIGKTAREAWREVLLWQGASEKAQSQIETYLQDNPSDPAIEAKLKAFALVLPDQGTRALLRGYNAAATDPAKAEEEFKTALRFNPNNPDALIMLAAMRRSQGRQAEAQILIDKAIAIAPDRKAELLNTAGGDYPGTLPFNVQEQVEVVRLDSIGDYDMAEKLLTRLYQGREQPSFYIQLGGIQLRAGQLDDAEKSFRQARTMSPRSGDAACGLADALGRKGSFDEAEALLTEAAGLYAKSKSKAGQQRIAVSRAGLLHDRAATLDAPAALALYQTALAADPRNIYVRLELAKAMQAGGQNDEASALMAKGVDLAKGDSQAYQIARNLSDKFNGQQRVQSGIQAAQKASMRQLFTISNGSSGVASAQ